MIDIHAHILPYVDDGAEDLADAILMAELAVESGVHTIIATPHSNIPGVQENFRSDWLLQQFEKLQNELDARKIPLKIRTGMEIFATDDVAEKIRQHWLLPLNQSDHYLIEFDFYMGSQRITHILESVCELGVVPVIAHPERYISVQRRPQVVWDWIDMGCQLQMNRGSIFGSFGKSTYRAAEELMENDCITYIASDAHSPYRRTTFMQDIWDMLKEEYSLKTAERILMENPQKYLRI